MTAVIRLRSIRLAPIVAVTMVAGSFLAAGCAGDGTHDFSAEYDPAELRTDYRNVGQLLSALEHSTTSVIDLTGGRDHGMIARHVENIKIYAQDLPHFRPEGRGWSAVQRYDNYVRSIQAVSDAVEHSSRLRRMVDLRHEASRLNRYLLRVRSLLRESPETDGDSEYRARLESWSQAG